jgi:hypothetical protein
MHNRWESGPEMRVRREWGIEEESTLLVLE